MHRYIQLMIIITQGNALHYCFNSPDIDECAEGTDNCEAGTTCVNTAGGFICAIGKSNRT